MSLKLIDAGHDGKGIYLGGFNIAPDGYLIHHATSFDDAWEALVEQLHDENALAECDCPPPCEHEEPCDCGWECTCDSANGVPVRTDDVVMRPVRPTWKD